MANNYFQFKQFTIHQRFCAMKVTTDACVFGAWAASMGSSEMGVVCSKRILDIGTGTGLLALMMAQKNPKGLIDAVEIDTEAAKEATENVNASPFKERVFVFNEDVICFKTEELYDFILTNPPFFDNDLKSDSSKRNLAMHSEALGLDDLLASIKRLLKLDGQFAILLPTHRSNEFEDKSLAEGFYVMEKVLVKQTSKHTGFRTMLLFGLQKANAIERELIIKENDCYTINFITLLKDYYLHL